MKISKKQKAILKSYARGVLVSLLSFLASNELGAWSVIIAALAGPAARALDKSDSAYGLGADEA